MSQLGLNWKNQTAAQLNVSIDDLWDWSVYAGAIYDNETFISKNFVQISFNVSKAIVASKLEIFDKQSDNFKSTFTLQPSFDKLFLERNNKGNFDINRIEIMLEHYNEISGQVYETKTNSFTLACPSEINYSLNRSLFSNVSHGLILTQATNSVVYSKPCSSPRFYMFDYVFLALNDYGKTVRGSPNLPSSIQSQFNQLLDNSGTWVTGVALSEHSLQGTYKSSTILIVNCIRVKLEVRSIVDPGENPLVPLLAKEWPPIMADNTALIIPKQNKLFKEDTPELHTAPVIETLSFRMFDEQYLGDHDPLVSSLVQQSSTTLNLPTTCFRQPQLERGDYYDNDYLIFRCNVSSVCDDGVVDISAANATFWRLLDSNQLIFQNEVGVPRLAKRIPDIELRIHFIVISESKPTKENVEPLVRRQFPDLPEFHLEDNDIVEIYDDTANVAINARRIKIRTSMYFNLLDSSWIFSFIKKFENWPEKLLDMADGTTITIPDQYIGPFGAFPAGLHFHLYYSVTPSFAIRPVVNRPRERVRFNLKSSFERSKDDDLLTTLVTNKAASVDKIFSSLFKAGLYDLKKIDNTKYMLQIDWYNLSIRTEPGSGINGFSSIPNMTDFATTLVLQYLQYYNISDKGLLTGSTVSGVDYAGFYNGKLATATMTDVIQVSFAVATVTGLQEVNRPTHGGITLTYKNETLFAPLQFVNGSAVYPAQIRTIEILIACPINMLPWNNLTVFVANFRKQLTEWTKIPSYFFMNHDIGPWTISDRSTQFRLNVTDQVMNRSIALDALYGNFTTKLANNKITIKDEYNYPIHILPLKKHNFIIVGPYDETYLKTVPGIAATVILVLTVAYVDISFRIKSWFKKRAANRIAVSVQPQAE